MLHIINTAIIFIVISIPSVFYISFFTVDLMNNENTGNILQMSNFKAIIVINENQLKNNYFSFIIHFQ